MRSRRSPTPPQSARGVGWPRTEVTEEAMHGWYRFVYGGAVVTDVELGAW